MIDSFEGQYRFLSNFAMLSTPVVLDGEKYKSTEHAYQAAKFMDPDLRKQIRDAATPNETKKLARKFAKAGHQRPDWQDVNLGIMEDLLRQKFSDLRLRRMLVGTGKEELVEGNTWHDFFWGVCNGVGENHLGKLLMKIREEIGKDPALIPKGIYCYDNEGICPYWSKHPDHAEQEDGYCAFLECGDWEEEKNPSVSLLWDQVKECRYNECTEEEEARWDAALNETNIGNPFAALREAVGPEVCEQLIKDAAKKAVDALMDGVCPGCGRPEIHKMCPAWGTEYYMSGKLFTKELEEQTREQRQAALERAKGYTDELT
jgi:ribA/ribD-fused uncharacterized protein